MILPSSMSSLHVEVGCYDFTVKKRGREKPSDSSGYQRGRAPKPAPPTDRELVGKAGVAATSVGGPRRKATTQKATARKPAAKRTVKKTTARKPAAKRTAKRTTARKPAARKTTARKPTAKRTAKKTTARKPAAKPAPPIKRTTIRKAARKAR
jgi:hypothetical protein